MTMLTEMPIEPKGAPRGRAMIERADWAGRAFATYDIDTVRRVVQAAAAAIAINARELAEETVAETGFGVVEHKIIKNIACSSGISEKYRHSDFVSPVILAGEKIVEIPRPAGVVLALTPSTNAVATVSFKILLALMTRNAIIVSPHPYAKKVCAKAARIMSDAAVAAGAPDGCIQVVDEPSVPLINVLMMDERTSVIVATGGSPMVRSAYRSGNPAFGVGPGNVPVLVDASANLKEAAKRIVDSKSFDNSLLCTNESVLIAEVEIADRLLRALQAEGAFLLNEDQTQSLREKMFPGGDFDTKWVGRSAIDIAHGIDVRVPPKTRILIAPFPLVVPEEPLAHEKLCPVLGFVTVPNAARGTEVAKAVLRIAGSGHSAAIHSENPRTVMDFSAAVRVLRVAVNVGNSLGSAGFETNLAPTMTVGTGFYGRSSLGENLQPKHLINWTRIAYNADASVPMADFTALSPWRTPTGPVPKYPQPSNSIEEVAVRGEVFREFDTESELREEIRRLVIEELRQIIKG